MCHTTVQLVEFTQDRAETDRAEKERPPRLITCAPCKGIFCLHGLESGLNMARVFCSLPKFEKMWEGKTKRQGKMCKTRKRLFFIRTEPYVVTKYYHETDTTSTHDVDLKFGYTTEYIWQDEIIDTTNSKPAPPHIQKKKPTEKGKAKGGTGERQENLWVTLHFSDGSTKRERFCTLACLAYKATPKGGAEALTFEQMKETTKDKGQPTVYVVDHKNKRHTDSKLQNLQIIKRKDDPAAQKVRKRKTPPAKTTTKKTTTKKASTSTSDSVA